MDDGLVHLFGRQKGKASLGTKIIGKKIYAYDWVTSTNDIAHFLAASQEPEGSVVFAKGQTNGRGRQGNSWVSPYSEGLYFSVILRPDLSARELQGVTLAIALAVAKSLDEIHAPEIAIKWPNDVLLCEKKACGILTEMNLENDDVRYAIVGVGLNVNSKNSSLPAGSTSLKEEMRKVFDIADLSHIIIRHMDSEYGRFVKGDFTDIMEEVKRYSGLVLGGRVRVSWQDKVVEGYAVDFDEYGGLVIRRDNGMLETLHSGHLEKMGRKTPK